MQHVESSWTRDQTSVCCIGRQILNHWTTTEVLHDVFLCFVCMFVFLFLAKCIQIYCGPTFWLRPGLYSLVWFGTVGCSASPTLCFLLSLCRIELSQFILDPHWLQGRVQKWMEINMCEKVLKLQCQVFNYSCGFSYPHTTWRKSLTQDFWGPVELTWQIIFCALISYAPALWRETSKV